MKRIKWLVVFLICLVGCNNEAADNSIINDFNSNFAGYYHCSFAMSSEAMDINKDNNRTPDFCKEIGLNNEGSVYVSPARYLNKETEIDIMLPLQRIRQDSGMYLYDSPCWLTVKMYYILNNDGKYVILPDVDTKELDNEYLQFGELVKNEHFKDIKDINIDRLTPQSIVVSFNAKFYDWSISSFVNTDIEITYLK